MRVPCLLLAICCTGAAQDLHGLRTALEALRPQLQRHRDTRGATPALTVAKHRLRDWAESRLASFGQRGDEDALNRELQIALLDAGLLCPNGCMSTSLGYVDQVRVHHQGEFLTVQTSVGIACGYDDSAYVYTWNAGGWRRIFASEQNVYTKTGYLPQTIYAVQISEGLILTLGSRPGCSNAFQPLYYRLWRVGPAGPRNFCWTLPKRRTWAIIRQPTPLSLPTTFASNSPPEAQATAPVIKPNATLKSRSTASSKSSPLHPRLATSSRNGSPPRGSRA